MSRPRRVALVGFGLAGRVFHGPLLRATPGLELTSIITGNPARRLEAARDFPGAALLDTPAALWERLGEHDLVVIATPPREHVALARIALDAGLAVVVEKPLGVNAAEARQLVEHARSCGGMLVPFHNRRWDSDQNTLRAVLGGGELGTIHRYESRFERWRPAPRPGAWREELPATQGGGVLLDLGVHLVDQALHLFGPAIDIAGEVVSRRGGADDDVFIALEHAGGVRSQLWASAVCAAPGPRLRVLGSAGAYVVDHLDGQEAALQSGRSPGEAGFGEEPEERWGRLVRGGEDQIVPSLAGSWLRFYAGVESSLRSGTAPPVRAEDAVAVLEVLDAVRARATTPPLAALPTAGDG